MKTVASSRKLRSNANKCQSPKTINKSEKNSCKIVPQLLEKRPTRRGKTNVILNTKQSEVIQKDCETQKDELLLQKANRDITETHQECKVIVEKLDNVKKSTNKNVSNKVPQKKKLLRSAVTQKEVKHLEENKVQCQVVCQPVQTSHSKSTKHGTDKEQSKQTQQKRKVQKQKLNNRGRTNEPKIQDCKVLVTKMNVEQKTLNVESDRAVVKQPLKKELMKSKQRRQLDSVVSASPIQLRTRKQVKYLESTLEQSEVKDTNTVKIPIYKQTVKENSDKRKGDQYEFDSDSEKAKKRKRRKLNHSNSYDETIQNIIKNVMKKTKRQKKKVVFVNQRPKNNIVLVKKQNNNISEIHFNPKPEVCAQIVKSAKKIDDDILKKQEIYLNQTPERRLSSTHSHHQESDGEDKTFDYSDSDEYFVLAPHDTCKTPKIQILSDIQLKPRKELNLSIASPRLFKDGAPNANSTMVHNNILTPWRFNEINIRRNPHFITIKPSSLPCINQEMVLDHTIVDKLNETSKTETIQTPKKENDRKLTQLKLNEYMGCNIENKENENSKISLFDNDQFSPIKNRNRISPRAGIVKRRVLGEKNDNIENQMASPLTSVSPNLPIKSPNPNVTDFGFDSESDTENLPPKNKDDRPFRVSINVNDKKYQRTKKVHKVTLPVSDDENSTSDESEAESNAGEIKLFEDFNTTQELIDMQELQSLKRTKRRRLNQGKERQRRRKDVRTKEEEEEAEKWAEAFNSMCEEVEKFPLEIE